MRLVAFLVTVFLVCGCARTGDNRVTRDTRFPGLAGPAQTDNSGAWEEAPPISKEKN